MWGFSGFRSLEVMRKELNSSEDLTEKTSSHDATSTNEVHILLVDTDKESLISTAKMLEMCSYKVTMVECVTIALAMLSVGDPFNIVIADVHSPDYQGLNLLEKAVSKQVLVILMSFDEEKELAKKAIENGALMLIKKPLSLEMATNLWQHVMRENLKRMPTKQTTNNQICQASREGNTLESDLSNKNKGKKKVRAERSPTEDRPSRRKVTEWTTELHLKFMDAVHQLGEGRCYPKDIMEKMKVPGLTRLQVASHLQKCRNENWRVPQERKSNPPPPPPPPPPSPKVPRTRDNSRKFGTMPRLKTDLILQNGELEQSSTQGYDFASPPEQESGLDSILENGMELLQEFGTSNWGESGSLKALFNDGENENISQGSIGIEIDSCKNEQIEIEKNPQSIEDFFEFPEMEYIIKDMSEWNQGPQRSDNEAQDEQTYSFDQLYSEQFPTASDMETKCSLQLDPAKANLDNIAHNPNA